MIHILDVNQAKQTILRRQPLGAATSATVRANLRRVFGEDITPENAVRRVIADVRERGDAALRDWTQTLDGVALASYRVARAEWHAAFERLDADLQESLRVAAERIRAFHARQPLPAWTTTELGGTLGQRVTPLARVGVYVPGGSAPLPSSLLMAAIPARVAGVAEIIVATPPGQIQSVTASRAATTPSPTLEREDVILAAAHIAGVDAVYRVGGAQAIAALAFGTETIPRVDKIVGPGGLFVTLAKQQLYGQVGLDGLAGPTETVIVADDSANPAWIAADILAQAEHDALATAILLTPARALAEAVQAQIARQLEARGRAEIIAAALEGQGGIVITQDLAEAVTLADEFAPEHLCLSLRDAERWSARVRHAGGVFIGERSFEVLGDYVAGPSHIMPTGGTARFASPLNALDFVRITSVIALDEKTARDLSPHAARLAQAESLDAHAHAARLRAEVGSATAPARAARIQPTAGADTFAERFAALLPTNPNRGALSSAYAQKTTRQPVLKLDANENPYGMSPRARAAVRAEKNLHRYPDAQYTQLRRALAAYVDLPIENLMVGSGADELIDLTLRAVIAPDDGVIDCPPSFVMYPLAARHNRARVLQIPRRADFSIDVDAVAAAARGDTRAKVLFVCSPNNPDGSVVADDDLRRLLELPVLVILDEAYAEFEGRTRIEWIREYRNLAVLRTFSKWAGLAGLRLGYGAFPDWLMARLWDAKHPFNVNAAAERAAIASLKDVKYLMQNIARLRAARAKLSTALRALPGVTPYPSAANFLLCRFAGRDARELKRALDARGIFVRYLPDLPDCLRITVGTPKENARLVKELRALSLRA